MTIERLLKELKMLRTEAEDYFPYNDSQKAGYIQAIEDIIELIEKDDLS